MQLKQAEMFYPHPWPFLTHDITHLPTQYRENRTFLYATPPIHLSFKNSMIQLDPKILCDPLHLRLHLILHAAPNPQKLPDLASIKHQIAAE